MLFLSRLQVIEYCVIEIVCATFFSQVITVFISYSLNHLTVHDTFKMKILLN